MTPRTLLALGAAVLAFSAGALAFDGTTGLGVDVAVAAETSHDAAPVHVTNADLRRVDSIEARRRGPGAPRRRRHRRRVLDARLRPDRERAEPAARHPVAHADGRGRRRGVLPRGHHVHLGRRRPRRRPDDRRRGRQRRRDPGVARRGPAAPSAGRSN
ncbi:hypothetical protein Q9Q99_14640 [Curtobacterium flaccumfaciens]|nr:hypothetical protein Q9Q99_14640 [Curtobacterium flaccumfaciens]